MEADYYSYRSEELGEEIQRRKKVSEYYESISANFNQQRSDSIGRKQSSVYRPIAEALIELSQSKSEKKVLIIYSDLMENAPDFSFNDEKLFIQLSANPDSIMNALSKRNELPALDGIEIKIVYQPLNPSKDAEFLIVSGFYRMMLESKGARVNISATLAN